jgi:hypothetical protein
MVTAFELSCDNFVRQPELHYKPPMSLFDRGKIQWNRSAFFIGAAQHIVQLFDARETIYRLPRLLRCQPQIV